MHVLQVTARPKPGN